MKNRKTYWYAFATFVGTIIGVGLFGLPYVGTKSGFWILIFYFILIGGLSIFMNLFYGVIAVQTKGLHRLPGYAAIYLGNRGKQIAFVVKTLAIFGALLAYLIIGGQFLASLLGGPVYLYTFIFFMLGAFLIWRDQKSVGPVEFIMLLLFVIVVIFLFIVGVQHIQPANLTTGSRMNFFAPYGVVLFSLWGTSIIPEVKETLKGNFGKIRKVIIWGVVTCVLISVVFSLLVIGVSGAATTDDALSGLERTFGSWVLKVGYFFGIITTFTSFIALGLTAKKIFWYDYNIPKRVGWALACFIPLVLFVLGMQNFIDVISLTGAVMLGIDGILITLIYLKLRKKKLRKKQPSYSLRYGSTLIILLLAAGVVLEILYFFKILT